MMALANTQAEALQAVAKMDKNNKHNKVTAQKLRAEVSTLQQKLHKLADIEFLCKKEFKFKRTIVYALGVFFLFLVVLRALPNKTVTDVSEPTSKSKDQFKETLKEIQSLKKQMEKIKEDNKNVFKENIFSGSEYKEGTQITNMIIGAFVGLFFIMFMSVLFLARN